MFKILSSRGLKRALVYVLIIGLCLASRYFLKASFSLAWLLSLVGVKLLLSELSMAGFPSRVKKIFRILAILYTCLLALTLCLCIVITPFSVYSYFFAAIAESLPDPLFVANLFLALITFLSLLLGGSVIRENSWKPFLGWITLLCGILLLMFQTSGFLIFFLGCLLLFTVVTLKKRTFFLLNSVLICLLLGYIFYNLHPTPQGSSLVDNFLFPQVRRVVNDHFPQIPLLLDIPGYGLTFGSRLGGSTVLTSTPVFEITNLGQPLLYLSTGSFDIYRDNSWQQSLRPEVYKPAVDSGWELTVEQLLTTEPVEIKLLCEVFLKVPYTGRTLAFRRQGNLYPVEPDNWPGIELAQPLLRNERITLLEQHLQEPKSEDLRKLLMPTDNIPAPVQDLAAALGRGATSQFEVLQRIGSFLSENYMYDLKAPVVQPDEDFLEKFLFQQKWGYCTHFATAFTVLARLNNIPARYATGYLVYFDTEEETKVVTARSAHAWPEIWFPGQGWVVWEATRAVSRDYYTSLLDGYADYLQRYLIGGDEIARNTLTLQQLRDLLGLELNFAGKQNPSAGFSADQLRLLLKVFLMVLSASAVVLGFRVLRRLLRRRERSLVWRLPVNRIVQRYRDIPPPENGGWLKWQVQLVRVYAVPEAAARELGSILLKAAYSAHPLEEAELEMLRQFRPRIRTSGSRKRTL